MRERASWSLQFPFVSRRLWRVSPLPWLLRVRKAHQESSVLFRGSKVPKYGIYTYIYIFFSFRHRNYSLGYMFHVWVRKLLGYWVQKGIWPSCLWFIWCFVGLLGSPGRSSYHNAYFARKVCKQDPFWAIWGPMVYRSADLWEIYMQTIGKADPMVSWYGPLLPRDRHKPSMTP